MTVSSYSSVYSSLMSPTSNISKDIISQNDKDVKRSAKLGS
ncbi:hypothetical protein [Aliarcobacter butzleri]|nr:hypothetical protein [Aliarcobacter butzleri]MCT7647936.1 hypothetical protein [Aliarcobacter butzleri]